MISKKCLSFYTYYFINNFSKLNGREGAPGFVFTLNSKSSQDSLKLSLIPTYRSNRQYYDFVEVQHGGTIIQILLRCKEEDSTSCSNGVVIIARIIDQECEPKVIATKALNYSHNVSEIGEENFEGQENDYRVNFDMDIYDKDRPISDIFNMVFLN